MKILVCGSRYYKDYSKIYSVLKKYDNPIIIHGGCSGADKLAGQVANSLNFDVQVYIADWNTYGKFAGPRRNTQMIEQNPDIVLVFHEDLANSKGTKDTISKAKAQNIPIKYYT